MIIYRAKYRGILFEFACLPDKSPNKAIILCDGLPTAPKNKEVLISLANEGFLVVYPRYAGTWESDGRFLEASPANDVKNIVSLIKKGEIKELYSGKRFNFNVDKIIIVGVSFGGAVALASVSIKQVDAVVSFSPVIDFIKFTPKNNCQDLRHLGLFMKKAFTNVYRFNIGDWNKMSAGKIFNPIDIVNKDNAAKILIFQNLDDTMVNYKMAQELVKKYDIKSVFNDAGGHYSLSGISKKTWNRVLKAIDC